MNTILQVFCLILGVSILTVSNVTAQQVNCTREATLADGEYNLSGTAILERFDDGTIQLRFAQNFVTDVGPDVQVFLSNDSTSTSGGVMLEDLGTADGIRHFQGALNMEVPSEVTMATYDFVVLRCVTFQAYWGGGRLGSPTCDDPGSNGGNGGGMDTTMMMDLCEESIVATTGWVSEISVCPNDGQSDIVPLLNNTGLAPGENYAYVFVDPSNNIKFLHFEDSYDFEGSPLETEFVFGVSYRGTLDYTVGQPLSSITSDSCAIVSSTSIFLTVNKTNCNTAFNCVESFAATTNWVTQVDICPSDGQDDIVPFINNQSASAGDHYAYLITDDENQLVAVVDDADSYNFEGSGNQPNRVFGISFAGDLNFQIGNPISSISADSCFAISDTTQFLRILKDQCVSNTTVSISGTVMNSKSLAISGVAIVDDNGAELARTDAEGRFTISDVAQGVTMSLRVQETSSLANGVSSTDLVLMARHILDVAQFISPYQLIAADANNNGTVSASDIVLLKRVILGLSNDFGNNRNWRFVDANQQFDLNLSEFVLEEILSITTGSVDISDVNFIGIKIGDVNVNATVDLTP